MTYTVIITQDPEDVGVYSASIPAIPGCFSCGKSKAKAVKNIKEALHGCLKILKEDGLPIPSDVKVEIVRAKV